MDLSEQLRKKSPLIQQSDLGLQSAHAILSDTLVYEIVGHSP